MYLKENHIAQPFFSICIPQYNRTTFLIYAISQLAQQTYKNFEVCISDDCSTDGREQEVINALRQNRLSFLYRQLDKNSGYDVNLRHSIQLASGCYCLLMGNDDCLGSPSVLADIARYLVSTGSIGVAVANFCDFATGRISNRAKRFEHLGTGPEVAIRNYRKVTFLSGIILNREACERFATHECDGTDFYQMFLAVRIITSGLPLVNIPVVTVRKDIVIAGEPVENLFLNAPVISPCPIMERRHKTLMGVGVVLSRAIKPYVSKQRYDALMRMAMLRFYVFTCTFWIFQFKRMQSFNYAAGIVLGLRPRNVLRRLGVSWFSRSVIMVYYATVSTIGLLVPTRLFFKFIVPLYKRLRGDSSPPS